MIGSFLLGWWFPFEMIYRGPYWEVTVPSIVAIGMFWGAFACLDLVLHGPRLVYDIKQYFHRRAIGSTLRSSSVKKINMVLLSLNGKSEALARAMEHTKVHNLDEALWASILLAWPKVPLMMGQVPVWLDAWVPTHASQCATLIYERLGHTEASIKSASPFFFKGRMPEWLEKWSGRIHPQVSLLADLHIPSNAVDASWLPLLKRIVIAKILSSHTLEAIRAVLVELPKTAMKDPWLCMALLERLYFLGLEDKISTYKDFIMLDDGMLSLYASVYAKQTSAYPIQTVLEKFSEWLKKQPETLTINQHASVYLDLLSHGTSQNVGVITLLKDLLRTG
jgi:hypothetical protein